MGISNNLTPERKNLVSDYFNPETRKLFGIYGLPFRKHVSYLLSCTNISAIVCDANIIVQPGVARECAVADRALRLCPSFLRSGVIKFPIREGSYSDFEDYRRSENEPFAELYPHLYEKGETSLLVNFPEAISHKSFQTGLYIAEAWEAFPDTDNLPEDWSFPNYREQLDKIRNLPSELMKQELPVTWPQLQHEIGLKGIDPNGFAYRSFLQHIYLTAYSDQSKCTIMTRLPYIRYLLGVKKIDLRYDYEAIREALRSIGLYEILSRLVDEQIVWLRNQSGFFNFIYTFDTIAGQLSSAREVGHVFANLYAELPNREVASRFFLNGETQKYSFNRIALNNSTLTNLNEMLERISETFQLKVAEDGLEVVLNSTSQLFPASSSGTFTDRGLVDSDDLGLFNRITASAEELREILRVSPEREGNSFHKIVVPNSPAGELISISSQIYLEGKTTDRISKKVIDSDWVELEFSNDTLNQIRAFLENQIGK